jgi:hypothetical protein
MDELEGCGLSPSGQKCRYTEGPTFNISFAIIIFVFSREGSRSNGEKK